ncbi:hypothetical protein BH09PSE4_BH09PSE4_12100 [soil metagenome]
MSLLILTLLQTSAMETYRERTRADVPCAAAADTDDVTVCGRREADRYRVPFVVENGDRRHIGVPQERAMLLHRDNPVQALSPFLVESGMAGVSAGVTFGSGAGAGETHVAGLREPAP